MKDVVWYVEARESKDSESFNCGTAVAVWLKSGPADIGTRYLITCAHVIRGAASDGRVGYGKLLGHIRVWKPRAGYNAKSGLAASVVPSDIIRFARDEVPGAKRISAADDWVLLKVDDARFANVPVVQQIGGAATKGLRILGYPGGYEAIEDAEFLVEPREALEFRIISEKNGVLDLTGPEEARKGMSGGGLFSPDGELIGIYRAYKNLLNAGNSVSARHIKSVLESCGLSVVTNSLTRKLEEKTSIPKRQIRGKLFERTRAAILMGVLTGLDFLLICVAKPKVLVMCLASILLVALFILPTIAPKKTLAEANACSSEPWYYKSEDLEQATLVEESPASKPLGFTVLQDSRYWNLEDWLPVTKSTMTLLHSPAYYTRAVKLRRQNEQARYFRFSYRTVSGLNVIPRLDDACHYPHHVEITADQQQLYLATQRMKICNLVVDLSDLAVGDETTLISHGLYWNAFITPTSGGPNEWISAELYEGTVSADLTIRLPNSRFDSVSFYKVPLPHDLKPSPGLSSAVRMPRPATANIRGSEINWLFSNLKQDSRYTVSWQWPRKP